MTPQEVIPVLSVCLCRGVETGLKLGCLLRFLASPAPVSGGQDSEKHWQLVMRPKVQAGYLPVELIHLHALAE